MRRDNQIKRTAENATPTSSLVSLFSLSRGSCLMWVAMAKAARSWLSARLMTLVMEGSMEPWQLVPMMVPFSHTANSSWGTQNTGLGHWSLMPASIIIVAPSWGWGVINPHLWLHPAHAYWYQYNIGLTSDLLNTSATVAYSYADRGLEGMNART